MRVNWRVGLWGVYCVLAITGKAYNLLVFPLFLVVVRNHKDREGAATKRKPWLFLSAFLVSGLLVEILSWLGEYAEGNPEPDLLHPDLIPDLILALPFYLSGAVGWLIALRFFRFSVKEAAISHGVFGILIEQQGAILISLFTAFPVGLLWVPYVFLVYSPIAGIAVHFSGAAASIDGWSRRILKTCAALAILIVSLYVIGTLFGFIYQLVGWRF